MSCLRNSRFVVATLCDALTTPAAALADEPASRPNAAAKQGPIAPTVQDVALGTDGYLEGVVIDRQGAPVSKALVSVTQGQNEIARTTTTAKGHFRVPALRGGVYQISSSETTGVYRLWSQDSAPPAARQIATVVADQPITRGQMPLKDFFRTETFVIAAVVIAAIAIPVAIHNSRDDDDSGS